MLADWVARCSDPEATVKILEDIKLQFENCRGNHRPRDGYFQAVETAENQLSSVVENLGLLADFHTPRYWEIERTSRGTDQPWKLIQAEVEWQVRSIDRALGRLQIVARQERSGDITALRAILDTNVYLHYKPYCQIDWKKVLDSKSVRLVLPLVVIRELDDKKNGGGKLGQRAGRTLRDLRRDFDKQRGPVEVKDRSGVTLEIPFGFDAPSSENCDEEILSTALALSERPSSGLVVVTGDYSMQLRVQALGLSAQTLEDSLRMPLVNHE